MLRFKPAIVSEELSARHQTYLEIYMCGVGLGFPSHFRILGKKSPTVYAVPCKGILSIADLQKLQCVSRTLSDSCSKFQASMMTFCYEALRM